MVNTKIHCTALVGAATLFLSGVNAHGYLGQPAVAFPNDVDKTQFIATIEASASGLSGSFSGSPTANTEAFWTAFKSSKFTSIKEFVTDLGQVVAIGANLQCGLTNPDETAQPLPDEIEWTHSDTEGFTSSHEGPCEAWCDGTQVFQDTNCAAHFTTAPAKMPYDKAGCSGANRLTFYWLALHSSTWQVYVNCAALEGGSGSNTPSESNTTTSGSTGQSSTPTVTTATPTTSTATPTATTSAPTASGSVGNEAEEDCDSLDVAGSDEEDGGSLDVAGSDGGEVGGDAETIEEDCGSLDVAGTKDEDCGSLDAAGSEAEEATTVSESSLNFDNVGGNYISGKVQPQKQN
ncbi:hypothetical protein F442_12958 [Phytophthora nicotianae P10297]|uniref:Chitin-binding type-4 domain-containing protein n=2 Tax=Phytophthora nicotianae TaxID=4792 RepID=W2R5Q1_PHYN3|nr:hypothetical protein PPTG_03140 [Phytophthora nicotianae INRA-310]ETN20049.1 hypothetical protein PPTG_03140 [Phytophthora nicotianae INRA-310]ETP39591.1 hypothetical protein F442_12958 [Phytophthora nicotianae P10297]